MSEDAAEELGEAVSEGGAIDTMTTDTSLTDTTAPLTTDTTATTPTTGTY
jgi:hypothetical protein